MQKKLDLNIVGFWNTRIFTPQWIAGNLLPESSQSGSTEIEGTIDSFNMEFGYSFCGLNLLPRNNQLKIEIQENTDALVFALQTSLKVFKILNQTPVFGVGFNANFVFEGTEINSFVRKLTNEHQRVPGFDLLSMNYCKPFENYILNVAIRNEKDKRIFTCNYHHTLEQYKKIAEDQLLIKYLADAQRVVEL